VNPRAEAVERLGGRYEARVLEPSPPAVDAPPWFADDPVARGEVAPGVRVVSPVATGNLTWQEIADQDPSLRPWCAERWLASHRRLGPAPDTLPTTRVSLHGLAERVISPARARANGKIGLRYTRGGFGTPFFGADVQIRVRGTELIVQEGETERAAPITTLAAAGRHVGSHLGSPDLPGEPLDVDSEASAFLGDWYGFAAFTLERLRAEAGDAADASRVQLWPEHFDLALELGREADRARAAYGLSPGDEQHPEPYIYVAPWNQPPEDDLWSASAFAGAELGYAELRDADDQLEAALGFFRARLRALIA
jgi:hypothetical protein